MAQLTDDLARLLAGRQPDLMDKRGEFSVLVPLVEGEEGLSLLYEVRARTLRSQPGEICFPGGRMEAGETPEECALRETREELSIPPRAIQILGRLDFIAHRAGFLMHAVAAKIDREAVEHMRPSPAEVAETFLVPLDFFLKNPPLDLSYDLVPNPGDDFPYEQAGIPRDYAWRLGRETVPVYRWRDRVIWGLTGRITRNLLGYIRRLPRET